MKNLILAAAVAIAAVVAIAVAPAAAAVPTLSGDYALEVTVICQSTTTFPGQVLTKLADANYNPATGMVTVNGWETSGSLNVLSGGTVGMTTTTISYTSPYSNDATTLTAAGVTWNIEYGPVTGSNVAKGYMTNGLADVGGVPMCNGYATALQK